GSPSQWRRLTGEAIPLKYEIRRAEYVVDLCAFENGSAGLDVQPKTLLGANLQLRSDQPFMDAIQIGLAPESWPNGHRYWILPNWVKSQPFRFSVLDQAGRVLGNEELPYREVRAFEWKAWMRRGA